MLFHGGNLKNNNKKIRTKKKIKQFALPAFPGASERPKELTLPASPLSCLSDGRAWACHLKGPLSLKEADEVSTGGAIVSGS